MRTEDGYIIHKCLNGESGAFGILVDKYKAGIFAFAYDKLGSFQDAEDVTQEVFERAYRNLHSLRRWESFASWLYRIASNQCKRWFQVRSRRPDSEFTEEQAPKVFEKLALDAYRNSQMDQSLRESLDSLSSIYREVLILHYFGGLTIKDIARAIGASPTAIGVRLSRARAQLREEMVAMMDPAFEGQRLQASFTFRIVESVKRMKAQPMNRTASLPWGLSLAAGIIITILSLNPYISIPVDRAMSTGSPLSVGIKALKTGEIPVSILKISEISVISSRQGGNSGAPRLQALVLEQKFPDKPVGSLQHGGWVGSVAFNPDGKILASGSGDRTVRLWNVQEQKQVSVLAGHTDAVEVDDGLAFSPDGKLLASGSRDKTIRLWSVAGQKQVGLLQHPDWAESVSFSPDGKLLASSSRDEIVRLWDVQEQKQIGLLEKDAGRVICLAFSPDGELLASAPTDGNIYFWDAKERKQIGLLKGHWDRGWAWSIAFSPDGKTLAAGHTHGSVSLWNVKKQAQMGLLEGHIGPVYSVAFSPDGEWLASGGPDDNEVHLWNVHEKKQAASLQGHMSGVYSVAFSSDGKWLASGSIDSTVLLWEVNVQGKGISVEPMGKQLGAWGEVRRTEFFQNFPNPFNPETWIPYQLAQEEDVAIRIHSASGQLVRTLNIGRKPAGAYTSKERAAHWDGMNSSGEQVASNVYFYTIQAGDFTATKKMMVAQ